MADRLLILRDGRLAADGPLEGFDPNDGPTT
jgi:ABC-type multidrug transport system ATPase subunit